MQQFKSFDDLGEDQFSTVQIKHLVRLFHLLFSNIAPIAILEDKVHVLFIFLESIELHNVIAFDSHQDLFLPLEVLCEIRLFFNYFLVYHFDCQLVAFLVLYQIDVAVGSPPNTF